MKIRELCFFKSVVHGLSVAAGDDGVVLIVDRRWRLQQTYHICLLLDATRGEVSLSSRDQPKIKEGTIAVTMLNSGCASRSAWPERNPPCKPVQETALGTCPWGLMFRKSLSVLMVWILSGWPTRELFPHRRQSRAVQNWYGHCNDCGSA
jgi:hypothetical protein